MYLISETIGNELENELAYKAHTTLQVLDVIDKNCLGKLFVMRDILNKYMSINTGYIIADQFMKAQQQFNKIIEADENCNTEECNELKTRITAYKIQRAIKTYQIKYEDRLTYNVSEVYNAMLTVLGKTDVTIDDLTNDVLTEILVKLPDEEPNSVVLYINDILNLIKNGEED